MPEGEWGMGMVRGHGLGRQRRAGRAVMLWAWLANLVLIFPVFLST
jgi:hypothetical protein